MTQCGLPIVAAENVKRRPWASIVSPIEVEGLTGGSTEVAVSNLERLSDGTPVAAAP